MDDYCFRLSLLSQILVLLQDVNCFSNENENENNGHKISRAQEDWIGEATKKTFYLISLHQNGKEYFRFLRSIFRNEKNWVFRKILYAVKLIFADRLENLVLSKLRKGRIRAGFYFVSIAILKNLSRVEPPR